ncbi:hypothetical protein KUH03_34795 [Sphingobacterium sp. E70]|nr:hypothetical protein KUH03_34795 [Sphingobacterium sp. E70]
MDIYQQIQAQQLDYNFIVVGEGTAKVTAMQEMPNAIFLGKRHIRNLRYCMHQQMYLSFLQFQKPMATL